MHCLLGSAAARPSISHHSESTRENDSTYHLLLFLHFWQAGLRYPIAASPVSDYVALLFIVAGQFRQPLHVRKVPTAKIFLYIFFSVLYCVVLYHCDAMEQLWSRVHLFCNDSFSFSFFCRAPREAQNELGRMLVNIIGPLINQLCVVYALLCAVGR